MAEPATAPLIAEHTAGDGYRWRYRRYVAIGVPRAHVVGIHGIQSHGGWYEHSCERLAEAGFLHRTGEHWHWTQEAYPADTVSLRSVTSDNFVIVDTTHETEVIGEVDFSSALTIVHPKAIYLHQGQQYHVDALDFNERKAYVKGVAVDYYTDAVRYTQVRVLEVAASDLGKVIGRQGRTARAMRTVLAAAGQKQRRRYILDILD